MPTHPERHVGALVATLRGAVEQGVVGHRELEAARGRHIRAVDGPVRERVHAQARPLRDVAAGTRTAHLRVLYNGDRDLALQERLQLVLRMQEAEVAVE